METVSSPGSFPRQDVSARYIMRAKLQALLERLFPNQPDLNFDIRIADDVWSFDAPRKVTEAELE
ncbi:hypothetical protein BGW36DRAFT_426763 [Talaromyces proteolyticus]|uniref:Uncharacterized protein n=1 Tax=Talaromyces proteolyticus TaxID=1131652 RepID=A0AAD4KXP8_9EURO|nr:uncharacterized protein BGW36DRAFT_426763 [Talaromyces proteolyticus]KAH8699082.1 hypothetical protein BGW36DRAFT_426763 [Talaromyces proteolyticus]